MSLDWSLKGIKDYKNVCYEDVVVPPSQGGDGKRTEGQMKAVTNAIIWMTMPVGVGTIKEANYREFAYRLEMIQKLRGALVVGPEGDVRITPMDVHRHIGLSTNASTKSRSKFLADMMLGVSRDIDAELRREAEKVAEVLAPEAARA
jgi:hypothetical protein